MKKSTGKRGRRANDFDHAIGARVRGFRVEAGVSLQELGPQIGVSWQQLWKIEKCQNRISAGRLFQVAAALDVPIERFFEGLS